MNAVGHCMRKSLSLVWGIWRGGKDFDPANRPGLRTRQDPMGSRHHRSPDATSGAESDPVRSAD
jgi:hypothetical protein